MINKTERLSIDSDLLQTFVAIAKCGNLTVAAGQIGRTQSAISVQLRKLESGLDVLLFLRTAKGMTLTPAGETLLPRAEAILADMKETANLFLQPLTGSIRIGIPDDFDERVLEQILTKFSRAHPNVQVMVISGCTTSFAKAIDNGQLDVAVCSGPDNHRGKLLNIEETVWATKKGTKPNLENTVPLAILNRSCWWSNLPINALDAAEIRYEIAFRSSSFSSLQSALRAGFAVGLLPKSSVTPDFEVLTRKHGFPELPDSRRTILVSENTSATLSDAMEEAIFNARQSIDTTLNRH